MFDGCQGLSIYRQCLGMRDVDNRASGINIRSVIARHGVSSIWSIPLNSIYGQFQFNSNSNLFNSNAVFTDSLPNTFYHHECRYSECLLGIPTPSSLYSMLDCHGRNISELIWGFFFGRKLQFQFKIYQFKFHFSELELTQCLALATPQQ